MRIARALVTAVVPLGIALAAFLSAKAIGALVEGTLSGAIALLPMGASESTRASAGAERGARVDAILDRNPFDHVTGALRPRAETGPIAREDDPASAPPCEGVRPLVLVGHEDQAIAFAALDVGGARVLRRRGGEVGDKRLAYVGRDRVWLEGVAGLCQARLFAPVVPKVVISGPGDGATPPPRSALETEVARQIVKTGPNEFQIERSAVDRILEAQQELMKARLMPEKEGDRVVGLKIFGIKPESVLGMLGIQNGDRLETINGFPFGDPEKMLEAYARLRTGADRLSLHLTRAGKPMNVDYSIR